MGTPITPEPPIVSMSAFMPRPGQPGSLDVFNGENISDYLESFNAECELYGVKAEQRALRFPHYCNPEIKDIVTLLTGYEARDWDQLQVEIKKFYWQHDHPKNTFTALNALIRRSHELTLSAFVLKFTAITNVLVTNGVMSAADRVIRLLEGLDEGMRIKVIKLCTQKSWKITDQDSGESPKFDEIKKFLDDEAKTGERFAVYERDHTMRGALGSDDAKAIPQSASTTAVGSPTPVPMDPAIRALTEQMEALTLLVKSSLSGIKPVASVPSTASAPTPVAVPAPRSDRIPRCIWCDSREHSRRSDCALFMDALKTGNIKINENGRVAFTSTGAEIPPAFGRGGMKSLYDVVYPAAAAPTQAATRAITFDDGSDDRVHGTRIATVGKDKDEWIDVTVDEKRPRDDGNRLPRNVRRRMNEPAVRPGTPIEPAPTAAPGASPAPSTATMDMPDPKPKYRLQSELGKSISVAEVGEKIMNAPIMLSIKEFLAVSPEMSGYIHEQTRRKRIPVEDSSATAAAMASAATSATESEANTETATVANVCKPYYAIPSGRAVVVLNDKVRAESLLDDGSELNLMAEEVYKELGHPIDGNIRWRINGFDSRVEEELDERYGVDRENVLGVLHNVIVDVGGIEVKQHIFVVRYLSAKLILGRPWGRSARAVFTNEDDGSYTVTIRSPDGMREVKFLASPAEHKRNREFVRPKE